MLKGGQIVIERFNLSWLCPKFHGNCSLLMSSVISEQTLETWKGTFEFDAWALGACQKKKTERIEKTVFDVNFLLNLNHSHLHLDIHYC